MWSRSNKIKTVLWFTEQLYTLHSSGIGFGTSLQMLQQTCSNSALRLKIKGLVHAVQQGKPLSQGLRQYPELFDPFYIEMIKTGEETGKLPEIFKELQSFWQLKEKVRDDLLQALTYPIVVMTIMILLVAGLCFSVIPQFEQIFKSFNAPLPWPTQILFAGVHFIKAHFILLLVLSLFAIGLIIKTSQKSLLLIKKNPFVFKLPLFGKFYHALLLLWFFKVLGITLRAGLSMQASVKMLQQIFKNTPLLMPIALIQYDLQKGEKLSDIFAKGTYFPAFCQSFILIAEETGTLDEQFLRLSTIFAKQVNTGIERFKVLLEPLMMLVMGLIVGSVVLAIYYPIFTMGSII